MPQKWKAVSINNKFIVAFAGVTMVATVLYSSFAGWQLVEIHRGARDTQLLAESTKRQADKAEIISASIQQAATAMDTSNTNAIKALDASRDASRTDQRAWMDIIITAPPNLQEDRPFSTTAEMKNLGKTPAKNIQFGYRFEGVPPSAHFVFDDTQLKLINAGMLPPQGPSIMPVEITPGQPDELLGKGRFEAIRDGKIVVFYWGLIKYDDVFGFHHWLKFCYIYNVPHRRFNLVSIHNDIDKETR